MKSEEVFSRIPPWVSLRTYWKRGISQQPGSMETTVGKFFPHLTNAALQINEEWC